MAIGNIERSKKRLIEGAVNFIGSYADFNLPEIELVHVPKLSFDKDASEYEITSSFASAGRSELAHARVAG